MRHERARRRGASGRPAVHGATRSRAPVAWRPPVWWPLAFVLAAAELPHHAALRSPFFADDWLFLDSVRSRSLVAALRTPDPIGNFFRPLGRAAWFWALARAGGESPLVFHAANLALWLACVALLWSLARRLAGPRAAAVAAAVFACTQAADVPVRWASGSQDLLALTLTLAATLALVHGRRAWAAALFLLAPFAKETVALAALPAALLARRRGEGARATLARAWPAFAATLVWAAVAALVAARRPAASVLSFTPASAPGALAGAVRTLLGIEWAPAGAASPWATPLVVSALTLAAAAVVLSARDDAAGVREREGHARGDVRTGALAWFIVGAAPVAFVAPIWSAYFYVYAIAGAALLAGSLLADAPLALALLVVLLLGGTARRAGSLRDFAPVRGAFTAQSHVNDFYLDRGMNVITRAVEDLLEIVPHPPPHSTFFFSGIPAFSGFQTTDGPLVRAVYRDSSLRSYFLSDLTPERVLRGPPYFVAYAPDRGHLVDHSHEKDRFVAVILGHIGDGNLAAARSAVAVARACGQLQGATAYVAGFLALADGDRAESHRCFVAAKVHESADGSTALRLADARAAVGDSAGAIRMLDAAAAAYTLDPRVHARLTDLQLASSKLAPGAALEAYVQHVLQPDDALAWRRWAVALYMASRWSQARDALEEYSRRAPALAASDEDAIAMRRLIPRLLPGGDILQRGLQREATR